MEDTDFSDDILNAIVDFMLVRAYIPGGENYGFQVINYLSEGNPSKTAVSFFKSLGKLVKEQSVDEATITDLSQSPNWGLAERHSKTMPVIIDYGISNDDYGKYYG